MQAYRLVVVAAAGFLAATGLALSAPQPAHAYAGSCPDMTPAAVLVADGICEVRFTESGVFTPPAGIAELSGVLVGGGGGAVSFDPVYIVAGKGGAVLAVDGLPVGGDLEIEIGAGGFSVTGGGVAPGDGGPTTVGTSSAAGGVNQFGGPFCGDGLPGFYDGGGARTPATGPDDCSPGEGYGLAALGGLDPILFPAGSYGSDVYGNGGDASASTAPLTTDPRAGTGGSADLESVSEGSPGLVILRFAASPSAPAAPGAPAEPVLPPTGADIAWAVPAVAAGFVAGGAALLALRRRRRSARE